MVAVAALAVLATGCASDLGIAPVSEANGVSANGWIAGYADAPDQPRAGFVRDPAGVVTRFGDGDHQATHMNDVNSTGHAVGSEEVWSPVGSAPHVYRAVRWDPTNGRQVLPVPPSSPLSFASGINEAGTMAGAVYDGTSVSAVLWASDGTLTVLPSVGFRNQAMDINDAGDIVGYETDPGQNAVWWDAATHTRHKLPGGEGEGTATRINAAGTIIGTVTIGGNQRAVVWAAGTHAQTVLPGSTSSAAADINAAGDIVGSALLPDGTWVAARWKAPAYDFESLGGLGGPSAVASGITSSGDVYGTARTSDGVAHAVHY